MTTRDQIEPTREQLGKIALLVGQLYGLKSAFEQEFRESAGDKLQEDARLACRGLGDAAHDLNHVLHRLIEQELRKGALR